METRAYRPTATIAIVTFAVLVLELTSTRLFAYIGSTHATSTALSIALLGLGLGAGARIRVPRWTEPRIVAPAFAAALLGEASAATFGIGLAGLVVVSLVPFALAGALVSDAYAERGSSSARATYAIDLFSGAIGCLVAPRLLGPLTPIEIMGLLGLLGAGLALFVAAGPRGRVVVALIAATHVGVLVAGRFGALPDGPLDVLLSADRHSEKAIVESATSARDVVDSVWSPIGRVDVHRTPGDPDRLGVFTDGMSPTYMVQEARARAGAFESSWGLLMSLPYRALQPKRVLVLASGAGAAVWIAKDNGASRVDAVEVNPAIPGILARWRLFAGDVYGQPGVRLFIEDARRYLADSTERYDLIELALALTGNAQSQPAGLEAHLYTVEAVRQYLQHLTSDGALVLIHSDPGNAYRQLLTVLEALASLGISRDRALEGIAVLRDPRATTAYRYMLVVRTSPMPLDSVDALDEPPAQLLWGPGDPPERRTQLLDRRRLGATAVDDLSPVHDERPYFFQNTRGWIATALAQGERVWVAIGALVLVLVLGVQRREDERDFVRAAMTAAGLGAAFLTVELALIQRLTLAAGGTLYAVSFVLFSLLAWSGAGALLLGPRWRRSLHAVRWASVVAAVAVALTTFVARDLGWLEGISSEAVRLVTITLVIAPAGLALGCPFPLLLAQEGEPAGRIASLWAINGAASVAGGIVAVLALRVVGSTYALGFAAALYALTALVAPRRA